MIQRGRWRCKSFIGEEKMVIAPFVVFGCFSSLYFLFFILFFLDLSTFVV